MKNFFVSLFSLAIMTMAFQANAQINTPQASPTAKFEQKVGLTDVMIEYSRPSMKGRTIFAADGLVPFGDTWRTGANSATKITFGDDVMVGGKALKAGSYALLTQPGQSEWKVMMYNYDKGSWSSYKDATAAATFMIKPANIGTSMETFLINIGKVTSNSAHIQIIWDDVMASIPLEVEVDKKVMADIERALGGPSTGDYYAAATYYHESGKDLNKALEYVQKATKVDEPKFWQVRREALILADMKRYKEATMAAEKSKMLAEKAGNKDYVRMNEKSLGEWKGMKDGMKMKGGK